MSYRLLALDMDGTLLTSEKRVSHGTFEALRKLAARGVPIAFSTGRNLAEMNAYVEALPFIPYASLMSGAYTFDLGEGRVLSRRPIETELASELLRRAAEEAPMAHVMTARESLACPKDIDEMPGFGMGVYQKMFRSICTEVDDLPAWVATHPGEVLKLNFYHRSEASRDRTRERLADLPCTLANSEATALECSALGVSKARGLQTLCEHLGITMEEVVAVGDAPNDLEALQAVGMPVAMGNATPEVLAVARMTVADNDHDGIVEVVEGLF